MKKGFTLVELLVVIAILGILAVVLVSSLSGSTESAKAVKCLANMHALALGCQAVGLESEYYPMAGSITKFNKSSYKKNAEKVAAQGWIGWSSSGPDGSYVSPYDTDSNPDTRYYCITNGTLYSAVNRNREVYHCPLHDKIVKDKHISQSTPLWSYAMNAYFVWQSQSGAFSSSKRGVGFNSIKRSDRILLFAELPFLEITGVQTPEFSTGATNENDPILQYNSCRGGGSEIIGFNHKQGKTYYAHVCYVDGHTDKLALPKNASSSNLKDLTMWLCTGRDSGGDNIDVSYDGSGYKAVK